MDAEDSIHEGKSDEAGCNASSRLPQARRPGHHIIRTDHPVASDGGGKRDDISMWNYGCIVGSKYMSLRLGGMSGDQSSWQ